MTRLLQIAAVLFALCGGFAGVPSAVAALPSEISVDIEDEVMCLPCGRPLSSSGGTGADDQRALIRRLADQGLSKQQIKDRLVTEYGERILVKNASPVAAVAPWAAVLVGVVVIAGVWRRRSGRDGTDGADVPAQRGGSSPDGSPAPEPVPALDPATDARIEAELSETER